MGHCILWGRKYGIFHDNTHFIDNDRNTKVTYLVTLCIGFNKGNMAFFIAIKGTMTSTFHVHHV
jgi:hypothetical protein